MTSSSASFRRLEDQGRFNHLVLGEKGLFYISTDYQLIGVFGSEIQPLLALPHSTITSTMEYPSIVALDHFLLVSNGLDAIFLIEWNPETQSAYLKSQLMTEIPIILRNAIKYNDHFLILGYTIQELGQGKDAKTHFDFQSIEWHPEAQTFTIQSVAKGFSGPLFTYLKQDGFMVGAEHPYESFLQEEHVVPTFIPNDDVSTEPFKYSWMQNEEEVTISIVFEQPITAKQVHCLFRPAHLKLSLLPPVDMPIFDANLFSTIQPLDSLWILENQRMLTIYLQKSGGPSRWPHVFIGDDKVDETMDPNVLHEIRQQLDKYTGDISQPMPHVLSERSEDVDFEGKDICFSHFSEGKRVEMIVASGHEWIGPSFDGLSVCLAYDVDGLVYTLNPIDCQFHHTRTIHALSFVRASKKDRWMTGTFGDFGFVIESKRHVYVYHASTGKQFLMDIGNEEVVFGVQVWNQQLVLLRQQSLCVISLKQDQIQH
jgi:hypothetical protein